MLVGELLVPLHPPRYMKEAVLQCLVWRSEPISRVEPATPEPQGPLRCAVASAAALSLNQHRFTQELILVLTN